jgi:hypothetical protein
MRMSFALEHVQGTPGVPRLKCSGMILLRRGNVHSEVHATPRWSAFTVHGGAQIPSDEDFQDMFYAWELRVIDYVHGQCPGHLTSFEHLE